MASLWTRSLIPFIDSTGTPRAGAKAYFFDSGTTTPKITYTDSALSIPHDHPVVADSTGTFPAVFLVEETTFRERVLTSADVTVHDVDGISVPTSTPIELPTSDTATEFLYQTGDYKFAHRTAAPTGFVRSNGRTIGSASSGASERANADCEDLFIFLWTQDANLAVSGSRGGTASGDWAANKTIELPDWRGYVMAGLDSMGNSAAGRITDAVLGVDSDTLGLAGGAQTHTLVIAELAAHTHGPGTLGTDDPGNHTHTQHIITSGSSVEAGNDYSNSASNGTTGAGGAHTHSVTTGVTASTGSDTAHNNLQPTKMVPVFIKL